MEPRLVYVDAENAIVNQKKGREWMEDFGKSLKDDVSIHSN